MFHPKTRDQEDFIHAYSTKTKEELFDIQKIYQEAQRLTSSTGVRYDVDHIIPLFEGGMHHPDNLQVITHEQHLKKTSEENSRRQSK